MLPENSLLSDGDLRLYPGCEGEVGGVVFVSKTPQLNLQGLLGSFFFPNNQALQMSVLLLVVDKILHSCWMSNLKAAGMKWHVWEDKPCLAVLKGADLR